MMDTAVLSGVLSYWALTSPTFEWRAFFAGTASAVLLLEAFLFRKRAQRVLLMVIAMLLLLVPASRTRLRLSMSYDVIIFMWELAAELFVGALVVGAVVTLLVLRPLHRRRAERRAVTPIRRSRAAPLSSHMSPGASRIQSEREIRERATDTHAAHSRGAPPSRSAHGDHPLVRAAASATPTRVRRRTALTRSHALAARLYSESEQRRAALSSPGLRAARAARSTRERAEEIAESVERVNDARKELEAARDVLRAAHLDARTAVDARDARVRTVRAAAESTAGTEDVPVSNDTFDDATEHLFELARVAQQSESDALRRVSAAQAVLRDVELWAQRMASGDD